MKRWRTMYGFCLCMNGVLLQTKDDWTYPVHPGNVVPLIETGIVKRSHLRIREIRDRAKVDSLAKAFTLLQNLWMTCNIIARRAALQRTGGEEQPDEEKASEQPGSHPLDKEPPQPPNRDLNDDFLRGSIEQIFTYTTFESLRKPPTTEIPLMRITTNLPSWNSDFPTKAEQVVWRVFSLVAFVSPVLIYLVVVLVLYELLRASDGKKKADLSISLITVPQTIVFTILCFIYSIARWGNLVLMFTSLRALPAESYTTIDWSSTIPHI
ncbi:hypothetical protein N7532_011314 [Penicillium argentinense]|uniref:Uncharacterized protein n=1 Tax=Penicillium argentinense TaxID=1131581 RepID=A0A9W9EIE9_9EURO|nr:uncharacterized protein N7532_011314 [Penicillium argentinense]KAJ5082271.1 hypothetical protein N7532_011314 [Penicillium argentinense]